MQTCDCRWGIVKEHKDQQKWLFKKYTNLQLISWSCVIIKNMSYVFWNVGSKSNVTHVSNECSSVVQSFNFDDFTGKELLTDVRKSGLYSVVKIDKKVLELLDSSDMIIRQNESSIKSIKLELKSKDTLRGSQENFSKTWYEFYKGLFPSKNISLEI